MKPHDRDERRSAATRRLRTCLLCALLAPALTLSAQDGGRAATTGQQEPGSAPQQVRLVAGRSTVLATPFDVKRIAVTDPEIADALAVSPREVLVDGKGRGTVSLIVWGEGTRVQYNVVVEPPMTALQQQLRLLFPGEDIKVQVESDAVVLSGKVSSTAAMLKVGEIVQASVPKSNMINLLQVPGSSPSQQVMLQVRFAEVNRRALMELGSSFFTGPTGSGDYIGRSTTQQFDAPSFDELKFSEVDGTSARSGQVTFSDFLNIFLFNTDLNLGVLIKALQRSGHFQSLAEPNLIAYNGREASFLAGGEFPVPIVQGLTGFITILWKEFGVRLNFTPTIAGDAIRLKVRPEVSSLDFSNGITLQGYRIPALTTRRAETEVELRDGQSFAIAGLLDNLAQDDESNVPFLSKIPIIGYLFRSKATRAEQTELLVLITPRLVQPLDPTEVPPVPTDPDRFMGPRGELGKKLEGGGGTVDGESLASVGPPKSKTGQHD